MRKICALLMILVFSMPAFAAHNSSALITPLWAGAGKQTDYSILITNLKGESINEVRIRAPSAFTGLECGSAPASWVLAYSDSAECLYKTPSAYINAASSESFAITATTSGSASPVWEVRTKDVLDGIIIHNIVTKVDGTPPSIKATTLTAPNGKEEWLVGETYSIKWAASDINDDNIGEKPITIEYYTDGKSWLLIAANETNDGEHEWKVPNINSTTVKVRITATDAVGNKATDESNSAFAVKKGPVKFIVGIGETKNIDIDSDKINDITVTLKSIEGNSSVLLFTKLFQAKQEIKTIIQPVAQIPAWVTVVMVILVIIILYLLWRVINLERKHKK